MVIRYYCHFDMTLLLVFVCHYSFHVLISFDLIIFINSIVYLAIRPLIINFQTVNHNIYLIKKTL